ncbi:alpha-mannosidase [Spirulina sp. CS-785/01]|uniref:alpha-mannosidase n=1 Tax=Spirulina sp. CS-785/01 TaxID=3021716 RepID=UPI00232FE176|nr:alpha-mannosidase [Spirulina sp. CS-785/01]MDB9312383.1 alpha-mannosidase [Spirulina sp. CS-785/01]
MNSSILETVTKLRQLTQLDIQANWFYFTENFTLTTDNNTNQLTCPPLNPQQGKKASKNENGYLVWEANNKVRWFVQSLIIPKQLNQYPLTGLTLRLCLTWWSADTQIFVNQKLVQAGDLFDSSARILLTPHATPGQEFRVAIRCLSPGHDIGGLMKSQLVYENLNFPDPGWIADELETLHKYYTRFAPRKLEQIQENLAQIDWSQVHNRTEFDTCLQQLQDTLTPSCQDIKERHFYLLGHAHLDMAWLWEVSETYEVAQRTFQSVLNLKKEFPELTFCHTSPALYQWLENHKPDLFKNIQVAVKAGYWETLGGMWIEPEVNLPSGESLARQLLYGQRYTKEKFGKINPICWLTDSFGFSWQLPQILQQGGIEYFVTQKLHWNDSTEFPYGVFWWESPDGTKLLTLMSPPNVTGVMDTNPQTMTNYAVQWEDQTGIQDIFWLPGVGDHGGGPSRDMLEVQRRWQMSPLFPQIHFTTAEQYLTRLQEKSSSFPVWRDELYLELHRGCYTTHADQKWFNRHCERTLYEAELLSSLATLLELQDYPKASLEAAWKQVLFNQFHDILPGTSIPEVFVTANQDWETALQTAETLAQQSLTALASSLTLPPPPSPTAKPFLVFNTLNWVRSQIISLSLPHPHWEVWESDGNPLPTQWTPENTLLFLAENIPSVGYRLFWMQEKSPSSQQQGEVDILEKKPTLDRFLLENKYLKIALNPQNGHIKSIYDRMTQQEVLDGEGNVLQGFQEERQYWDAWNIDPNYEGNFLGNGELKSIQWMEKGKLRSRIRIIRKLNHSTFTQDYILDSYSPLLKITTTVDWQETHVLVKAKFPFNHSADSTTYEIACGAISRTNYPQTPAEKAKWEVFGHRWADLGDNQYGVSLVNDCKYGYDSKPNQLRLTLLKSPVWPDPTADRGIHHFTYGIFPHVHSWQNAGTIYQGYELNTPLRVCDIPSHPQGKLPPNQSLLDIGTNNLILMACKQSEDNPNKYVLRFYEGLGNLGEFRLTTPLPLTPPEITNILEFSPQSATHEDLLISPWQIKTIVV